MKGYPKSLLRLIDKLSTLPGIGAKSAERLAFHLLRAPREEALELAQAIRDLKEQVRSCSICFNLADQDPCAICSDPNRDKSVICVVEQPKDLLAFERAGGYNGVYHVLMGHLSPLDGVEPEHLTIAHLLKRIRAGGVKEVILATNPTLEGDGTALYIRDHLQTFGVRLTRLARGLPTGATIEFAQPAVLSDALSERREMK